MPALRLAAQHFVPLVKLIASSFSSARQAGQKKMTMRLTLRAERNAAQQAGALAFCRLKLFGSRKPATGRRSRLSALVAGYAVSGLTLLWLFAAVFPGWGA